MESTLNALSLRFQKKGFAPIEIPRLITDVFSIVGKGRYFNKTVVNQELEDLGWGVDIMDTVTYKLIISNSWAQQQADRPIAYDQ